MFSFLALPLLSFGLVLSNRQQAQRFIIVPENVNITKGEDVTLSCKVENRIGEVQWVKSGLTLGYSRNITGFPRYSVIGDHEEGVFDLKITDVHMEDEGNFECQVLGPPPLRAEAMLFVDVKPTRVEVLPVGAAKVSVELEVTCKVYDARPKAEIAWKRNGNSFTPTSSEETEEAGSTPELIITTAVMKFSPSSGDNNAVFTCSAVHPTLTGDDKLETTITLEVLYPPNKPIVGIKGHTAGDPIRSGQSITLECESYGGNPLASLDWYKNGEKVDTNFETHEEYKSVNELTFSVSEGDNKAKFKCEANSPGLSDPLTAELVDLVVQFPAKKVKIKGPETASINETVTFKCSSTKSNPESNLTWVVDGKAIAAPIVITEGDDGSSTTKSEINITTTDHDRFKIVTCYANNLALGERMFKSHKVTIEWPPNKIEISGFKDGDVFQEGAVQKILCSVMDGNPMPKLIWKRGSKKIEDQTENTTEDDDGNVISVSSEMTIAVTRDDNKQDYTCTAKEDKKKGEDLLTKKIKLVVNFLPEAVDIKQPDKLVENQEAKFTCTSKPSNPEVDIVWHYNDEILPAGGSSIKEEKKYGGFVTTSFLVMELSTDHVDGHIKCEAKHNDTKRSIFDSIDLDVEYSPKFTTIPELVVAEVGEAATVTVSAKANPNVIDYEWKQANRIVPGEGSTTHSRWSYDKNVLTLTNIMKSDAGKWIVIANNSIGETEAPIEVSVQYPPEIISVTDLVTTQISLGSPVEIRCKVDANPLEKDTIKWEKEGSTEDFINQTTFSNTESILYLPDSNETYSGKYICVANNNIPKASPNEEKKSTFVRIKHAPIFDTDATITKVACDKEATVVKKCLLVCQAYGTPDVTITWSKTGNILMDDDKYNAETSEVNLITQKSELEIKKVTSADYDNYTCLASNRLGDVRHNLALEVEGKPDPPVHFQAIASTHNSITFEWKLDFSGGFKLSEIEYKIRQKKEGADTFVYHDVPKNSSEFTVEDLQSTTAYTFSILAINEKGESDFTTDKVQYSTKAEPVADPPPPPKDSPPPAEPKSYGEMLIIIATVGGLLLLCNLGLLYCYLNRKPGLFGGSSDSMTRSSILEMYFASSYNDTRSEDSRSYTSDRSETLSDSEITSRARIDTWDGLDETPSQYPSPRYMPRRQFSSPEASGRYFESGYSPRARTIASPYQRSEYPEYSPSPPPFPQEFRRRPWQGY